MGLREAIDKLLNWSGGSYVGLATLITFGLALAQYISGEPMVLTLPDGKFQIYMVHKAPDWFVGSVGIYTVILAVFAASKPINTWISQKGTPPPAPAPAPDERPLEK